MKVNIYLETDKQSQECMQRKYGYVIETIFKGTPITREGFGSIEGTYHKTNLQALIKALGHFHKECEVCVYTRDAYDDVFDFTARAIGIPPSILKGDVQDNSKAIDELLTVALDPLAGSLESEINRKKYGKAVLKGSRCMVDTSHVKHVDIFSNATQIDKLVQSGTHTINMILRAMGQPQINEEWANQHFITKNYSTVQDLLNSLEGGGENGGNGKNTE